MNRIELQQIVGGELQKKFEHSFKKVLKNLQDPETSYLQSRGITIKMTFKQDESRSDLRVGIDVIEKLAPQSPLSTSFTVVKDMWGNLGIKENIKSAQIPGQMKIQDYQDEEIYEDEEEEDGFTGETEENESRS